MAAAAAEGARQPGSSKYDFVKVRVRLSERHYYVLSRFLVSRVLSATKVHYTDAIRIALELKKALVDSESLELTQAAMEDVLFTIVKAHGYGEETLHLYRMVSSFHHQRIPLVVLIGGAACVGKSTLATQLAERLNLSSVLQTDVVYALMSSIVLAGNAGNDAGALPQPPSLRWQAPTGHGADVNATYDAECTLVERGLSAEFVKCFKEGKSMIVEGFHVHPTMAIAGAPGADASGGTASWVLPSAVIVPFLVVVRSEHEHWQLYQEWRHHLPPGAADGVTGDAPEPSEHFQQLRHIQQRLLDEAAAPQSAPLAASTVLDVDGLNFASALDRMHSVVLERMQQLLLLSPALVRHSVASIVGS